MFSKPLFEKALLYIKSTQTKAFDVYDLAQEIYGQSVLSMDKTLLDEFIKLLFKLDEVGVVDIKNNRSVSGQRLLGSIPRRLTINKSYFTRNIEIFSPYMDRKDLGINSSYYRKNPDKFKEHTEYINRTGQFLESKKTGMTMREISYFIFHDEKALTEGAGQMILKNLGLSLADLKAEEAIAPFYYETNPHGECVLVVENKDTCFSLFRVYKKWPCNIRGVIYGEGRAILKKTAFLDVYGLGENTAFLYFGDIDREGFDIYLSLKRAYPGLSISLSKQLYQELCQYQPRPPESRRKLSYAEALSELDGITREKCGDVLEKNLLIPQEALGYTLLEEIFHGNRLY